MHELAICQALIEQVESVAREQHAYQVMEIGVDIGPLSGVEPQLLEQAFSIASAGTVANGASLHLNSIPIRVDCSSCGQVTEALPARLICGNCGNWQTRVVSGDELLLTTVELCREPPEGTPPDVTEH
jgi:hydrogenase nickel incorporation protein HypA/HybF